MNTVKGLEERRSAHRIAVERLKENEALLIKKACEHGFPIELEVENKNNYISTFAINSERDLKQLLEVAILSAEGLLKSFVIKK